MRRRFSACIAILCLLLFTCIKAELLYSSKPTTTVKGLIARDDDHSKYDEKPFNNRRNEQEDKEKEKEKNIAQQKVTTEINIIYTTIIYTSASSAAATASPIPSVYNVSNTGPAHQEQGPQQASPSTNLDDPNKKDLVDSLQDDQQALKRMIMILSLVGGLGVIAVVATIVIFTRMRVKNRKQREIDEEGNEGSTFELSADVDRHSNASESDNNDGRGGSGALLGSTATSNSSITSSPSSSSLANGQTLVEPSAPPALMMIDGLEPLHRNRRNVMSMSSQTTAPSPSAPTAKELDAMEEDGNQATTSTPYNHHILHHGHHHHQQEQINSCSRCTPMMMAPELPPPAYTPSAPPHYALPIEANVIETSPSSSSSMSPRPSRRHSLGG